MFMAEMWQNTSNIIVKLPSLLQMASNPMVVCGSDTNQTVMKSAKERKMKPRRYLMMWDSWWSKQ